ncbi:hypothetical protein J2S78_000142 [Salibacterium salarium]|uniref:hypothetical protein n=1 Tax=Salibacterium salarium TaxID=284579 RepID=UPI00277E74C0|nr:hypothetical protein [Salibacterium salarium]MDQ0297734.1 hypothetical protein [Salibacterium salarium]
MNRYGILSLLLVVINVSFYLLVRGPTYNLSFWVAIHCTLSTLGIVFAIFSKKKLPMSAGIALNGSVFALTYVMVWVDSLDDCYC